MTKSSISFCSAAAVVALLGAAYLDIASADVKPTKESEIIEPRTVEEIELYIYNEVNRFIGNLERECPTTKEFKNFFENLKNHVKYVCPVASTIEKKDGKAYEAEMNDLAGKLLHAMATLPKRKKQSGDLKGITLKTDQVDAIKILNTVQSIAGKFMNDQRKGKRNGSIVLTSYQKNAIKFAILRWEETIIRVVKAAADIKADYTIHVPVDAGHGGGPTNGKTA